MQAIRGISMCIGGGVYPSNIPIIIKEMLEKIITEKNLTQGSIVDESTDDVIELKQDDPNKPILVNVRLTIETSIL